MFKVECPGCKAPYQVDERRVPSSGLKMRCPKCGTSFQVDPPMDPRTTGPSPVLGGFSPPGASASAPGAAKPSLPSLRKQTMLGVAGPAEDKPAIPKPTLQGTGGPNAPKATIPGSPGKLPPVKALAPAEGKPKVPLPTRPLGQKPPIPPRVSAKPAVAPLSDLDEMDLPAVGGRGAPKDLDLPAPV